MRNNNNWRKSVAFKPLMSQSVFVLLPFINKCFPPTAPLLFCIDYELALRHCCYLYICSLLLLLLLCGLETSSTRIRGTEKVNSDFLTGLHWGKQARCSPSWSDQRVQFINVFILNQRACLHLVLTLVYQNFKAGIPGINEVQTIFSHCILWRDVTISYLCIKMSAITQARLENTHMCTSLHRSSSHTHPKWGSATVGNHLKNKNSANEESKKYIIYSDRVFIRTKFTWIGIRNFLNRQMSMERQKSLRFH